MQWMGLDVHHRFIQGAVLSEDGGLDLFRVTTTDEGLADLRARCRPDTKVVFEASTSSFRLYDELVGHALEVFVAHPAQTKGASAWHVKTDMRDAETLARLLSTGFIRPVWVPTRECRGLRSLLEYRQRLTRERTVLLNRAGASIREEMLEYPTGFTHRRDGSLTDLASMEWPDRSQAEMIGSVVRMTTCVKNEIAAIDATLAQWSSTHPQAVLLQTIPGVGPLIASILIADIGNISRFPSAAKLCAYAGMVPRVHSSGKTLRIGHISRTGRHLLRFALWIATLALVRYDGNFHTVYARLSSGRPKKVALVACCRKLLTVVWHMLRTNQAFRREPMPPKSQSEPTLQ